MPLLLINKAQAFMYVWVAWRDFGNADGRTSSSADMGRGVIVRVAERRASQNISLLFSVDILQS